MDPTREDIAGFKTLGDIAWWAGLQVYAEDFSFRALLSSLGYNLHDQRIKTVLTVVGALVVVRYCKAWHDLILKYVGKTWLTRSLLSLLTYVDSKQITILSDSSFLAYDENYRRYDYKMPCGNIRHDVTGGANLLDGGIQ